MRKIIVALFLVALMASPAFALFTNGGFESGNFDGWTITYGDTYNTYGDTWTNTANPAWGAPSHYNEANVPPQNYKPGYAYPAPSIVTTETYPNSEKYITKDINPYNGSYMAQINDMVGYWHATKISQTATITAEDIGDTVYVNWGVIMEDPLHDANYLPYFSIKVLNGATVLDSFTANSHEAATTWEDLHNLGWGGDTGYGGRPTYYTDGQYTYDLGSGFSIGDQITIEMFVSDCGQGGHGSVAFLDGIGTEYVPPPNTEVPEPATLLLLGLGLLGLAGVRRKLRK